MQLTVKDLTKVLADNPNANINIAVVNGVQIRIMPANQVQVMINNINGKDVQNLLIIHNEEDTVKK